jgi:N-acetylmuramoyl-L-alanine amidase
MIKNLFKRVAHGVNIAALCGMVGAGAFYWKEVQAEQRIRQFDQNDILCLQQNIYFEARGESELGQRAVAWVTLNRVTDARWGDTICDVVFAPNQFSWTSDGISDQPDLDDEIERQAWEKAGRLSRVVIYRWALGMADPTDGADHYHASRIRPSWASAGERTAQIDNHIFYTVSW